MDISLLKEELIKKSKELGFSHIGFCSPGSGSGVDRYKKWISKNYHADMGYLSREDRLKRREDMELILPEVKSVIVLAYPYAGSLKTKKISNYALRQDYHELIWGKLKVLSSLIIDKSSAEAKYFADTGAILERDNGLRSGLGFIGKNTMLINPDIGSNFFIGEILTTLDIQVSKAEKMPDCGTCKKCMDACPTGAISEPYTLDSRRCISYLTIENKGSIPQELRTLIGGRVYGCDECLISCPWNIKNINKGANSGWVVRDDLESIPLSSYISISEEEFEEKFKGTPVFRIGYERFLRNVAVALGNTGTIKDLPALKNLINDSAQLVKEHVLWAVSEIENRIK